MQLTNTPRSYGAVARLFHWASALVIFAAFGLGMVANGLPLGSDAELALKAAVFSAHKTVGVLAFFLGLARIFWALTQAHPVPLHPDRRLEGFAAALVHWMLYLSLVIVPLSGWVHHAATSGFAPILWPFGQGLPGVPNSEGLADLAGALHWLFTKVLAVSILLHVAGALKHALIDRDATLARMWRGVAAGGAGGKASVAPTVLALAIFGLGSAGVWALQPAARAPQAVAVQGGNWQVESGDLTLTLRQMGQEVTGRFGQWQAEIVFDPAATQGNRVAVEIDIASLTIGSASAQATGPGFLNASAFPSARFEAEIDPVGEGWQAIGQLTLAGVSQPVILPFTLEIEGDRAEMRGAVVLDRRDFGIGAAYGDEATVSFAVTVAVALTARRDQP